MKLLTPFIVLIEKRRLRRTAALALMTAAFAVPLGVALAWVLAQGDDIVAIPGTKRRSFLEQNVAALDIALDAAEIASLTAAFPPGAAAGLRYPAFQLAKLGI